MNPIKPTVGRIVLVVLMIAGGMEIAPAIVNCVYSDNEIGVTAHPFNRNPMPIERLGYGDPREIMEAGTWHWMDYQLGQAAKTQEAQVSKPVLNPFDYNDKPTPEMIAKMGEVREAAKAFADVILTIPNGRERSLAMTNLEQTAMWANKSIAHGTQGQAPRS